VTTTIVIPCFNEADRLSLSGVEELCAVKGVQVILVNDGSTDATWQKLLYIKEQHGACVELLDLQDNVGKGEAVRLGLRKAIENKSSEVAYMDADFATSAGEMLRLKDILLAKEECKVLFAARWLHLGAKIERTLARHYIGRVFATLASLMLKMPVYDTQCGAKLFRVTDSLSSALASPFVSRWIFDVELIARLRLGPEGYKVGEFLEVPLNHWRDVSGSKLRPQDFLKASTETIQIWWSLRK
jgi:glycosyltransferase involved in cell wall biosynthesis